MNIKGSMLAFKQTECYHYYKGHAKQGAYFLSQSTLFSIGKMYFHQYLDICHFVT